MVYIPFESLSSPSRLSRTTFLAVYLLKAFVGALPTAVQELVPREDIQTFNLRLDRHARAGNNKAEVLCLNVVELGDHICSPDSSSVTSQDPIVESIDLGLIQFASVNDRKDTFRTAQQNAAVSKLLDPWQYTDDIMDSLFLLHSIPGETMKTWEGILIEKNKLPAVKLKVMKHIHKSERSRTGNYELHVGDSWQMPYIATGKRGSKRAETKIVEEFSTSVRFRNKATMIAALEAIKLDSEQWKVEVPDWLKQLGVPDGFKKWESDVPPEWIWPTILIDRAMELLSKPRSAGYHFYNVSAMTQTTLKDWKEKRDAGVKKVAKRKLTPENSTPEQKRAHAAAQRKYKANKNLQRQGQGLSQ
ncbi:hypothetical protein FB446DRAFT_788941 [Lentinula raphanica]|nr:hypothetical protein FB446DRAFT_788941 [Lentinula raphanica]